MKSKNETNPTEESEKLLDEKQREQVSGGKGQMSVDKPADLSKELLDEPLLARFPGHFA